MNLTKDDIKNKICFLLFKTGNRTLGEVWSEMDIVVGRGNVLLDSNNLEFVAQFLNDHEFIKAEMVEIGPPLFQGDYPQFIQVYCPTFKALWHGFLVSKNIIGNHKTK